MATQLRRSVSTRANRAALVKDKNRTAAPSTGATKRRRKKKSSPKLSRIQRPDGLSSTEWQRGLRQQFGREQDFKLKNIGQHPVFSEFLVNNPASKRAYRVAIRGTQPGDNYCSCGDFATNHLGTCKHIEWTLAKLGRARGGAAALKAGYLPPFSEVYLQYGAKREIRFRPGSECPRSFARFAAEFFDAQGVLQPDAFDRFDRFLEKGTGEHEVRVYDDARGFIAQVRDASRRAERVLEMFPRGVRSGAFEKLLKVRLFDYQRQGALFAAKAGRCLIGDEMGLGKTIQAIATAEIMARLFGVERVLIVCPTSLKHQWRREIEKFTDRPSRIISGGWSVRARDYAQPEFFKIANYDTVHVDLPAINAWSPDLVILDEAQRIKNWSTRAARAVKQISSPYAVVLTGTPLENRLEELISIVQFVDPHQLGPTWQLLEDHQQRDETGRVTGYRDLDKIGQSLAPILIRRRKNEVLEQLPDRMDKNFFVPMTEPQRLHHEENRETVARIVAKWRRYKFLSDADQLRLRISLQNMRMSCDSTYLLDHQTDFGVKADELATLFGELFESPESKVVVFSQWTRMLELIERRFGERSHEYVMFHGGISSNQRAALVDRFREDERCRVFLSTDAGGVGLNLQHASTVVNVDLPWNPAVLEQRIGRVHRLGQKFPVRVVNYVAQGTIEEGMLGVLQFKKSLFAGVLDGGESQISLGGSRLAKFIETVEKTTTGIPAPTVEDLSTPSDARDAAPSNDDDAPRLDHRRHAKGETRTSAGTSRQRDVQNPGRPAAVTDAPSTVAGATSPALAELLTLGLGFLEQMLGAAGGGTASSGASSGATRSGGRALDPQRAIAHLVGQDPTTGQSFLKLPVPPPELLERTLSAVGELLQRMRN